MSIKHIVLGFFAAAAVLVGCQPKEEDFGVARIEVSTSALSFGPSSSSQTLQVTASREWTVSGLPDWIAVDPAGGQPSNSPQTVNVTVISNSGYNREADIAFTIGLMKEYVKVSQTGEKGEIDLGKGTLESPYSVDGVIAYINNLDNPSAESPEKVYVKGKVSAIGEEFTTQYGNGTFYISDDGTTSATQFYVYRVKYLGNKGFTSKDEQVKVGDDVIIYGNVLLYGTSNPTYETAQGTAYLYSLNGKTSGNGQPAGDPKGTGTQEDPYNVAAAFKAVEGLGWTSTSVYDKVGPFYVKGKISQIAKDSKTGEELTYTQSGSYSNATFYISDDGSTDNEFYCYRIAYLGNKKYVAGQTDIKVGDEVVFYGELMNYRGNTPETVQGSAYLYSLNGDTGSQQTEEVDHGATTVASFLAAAESETDWYELTGVISNLKDGDKYGNFDLTDDSGTVYVYGVLSAKGGDKGKFQDLVSQYEIANGGTITIKATRGSFNDKIEALNGYFVSYKKGETPPVTETDHGATTVANFLAASESTTDWYEITGVISNLKDGDNYGNFDLTDDSGSVYVYGVLAAKGGEKGKFQELVSQYGIANGGTITIKANRGSYKDKAQAQNAYFVSYKAGEGGGGGGGETDHGATTVANFLAASESTTDWYELTGVISNLKDGDNYGNFDLTDDSGSVYVYGVLSAKGGEKGKFQELVSQYGIANGGTITIKANRGSYKDKAQAQNAYFVSYKAGEGGGGGGGGETTADYTSNLQWTLVTSAYNDEATVNGTAGVAVLKLGTSSKVGEATVTLPAGTKKVSFYGVSWKGKPATVAFKSGGEIVYKQDLAANDGASNTSPYTLTVSDSDKYTYTLSQATASDMTMTITTDGSNTRVIIFALKAE